MKKILSLLFALILLLCGCSGKDGKKGRGQKYVFPTSDAFSAEITAKQGDFTFSGLLTFSSESGLTLSYSEPSDIAGITVSLKDDTAKVTCPEMEPVIVSLPDSSVLCFTEKVFDALKNGECDGYAFGGRIINEGTFGGTDFRVTRDKATHNIMSVESSAYGIYIEFKYTA